jgi:Ca2+-binding EF-hand superfamily protein
LDNIAKFVKTKRISLSEQFRDKDKMNHRRVTQTGFAQVLQLIGVHLCKDDIDRLCVFYNDPQTNFVNYGKFVSDIDARVGLIFGDRASDSLIQNPLPSYGFDNDAYIVKHRSSEKALQWEQIQERLSAFVWRRRIRLLEFFEGFDQLRHGTVTKQKFRTVCGQVSLPLTSEQIDVCLECFTAPDDPDLFNYREFCKKVNKVFGPTELNRKPLNPGTPKAVVAPDISHTVQTLNRDDEPQFRELIERLKKLVANRRINLREQFYDYDYRPRKCYVTLQQFKQSLARLGLTTDSKDFEILCKRYRCTDMNDMNYVLFCRDVDPDYW